MRCLYYTIVILSPSAAKEVKCSKYFIAIKHNSFTIIVLNPVQQQQQQQQQQ